MDLPAIHLSKIFFYASLIPDFMDWKENAFHLLWCHYKMYVFPHVHLIQRALSQVLMSFGHRMALTGVVSGSLSGLVVILRELLLCWNLPMKFHIEWFHCNVDVLSLQRLSSESS